MGLEIRPITLRDANRYVADKIGESLSVSGFMNKGMYSSSTDEWETPQELFDSLDGEFHFTLDVCATKDNAKCSQYFIRDQDGLKQAWDGHTVWCNPPYGRSIGSWCRKCYEHSIGGGYSGYADSCTYRHKVVS